MDKQQARNVYRQKRMALSEKERVKLDDLMLIQFQSAGIPFIESLLTFWPIEENHEPDTHLFTEYLRFRNPELKVCYPRADLEKGTMQAILTDIDTPFLKTQWNIHEPQGSEVLVPSEIDLVFVPLLAFDLHGYRVGYGKGFYDKWLENVRPDCFKVGFSYFEPLTSLEGRHDFDVPLDLCITPHTAYVF